MSLDLDALDTLDTLDALDTLDDLDEDEVENENARRVEFMRRVLAEVKVTFN